MEVRLLGPVEVAGDDGRIVTVPGQKLQLLLAALAIERGKPISADRLVDIVYGDAPPRQPHNAVQVLVSRLRRSLAAAGDGLTIETTDAGYALVASDEVTTDLERFDAMVARARTRLDDDPGAAVIDLRGALDLVRGEPLAGLPAEGWARAERSRVTEAQLAAVEARIDAELAIGGHAAVVPELEQLTREHPLREHLWAQLVLALYRCGRQADALRAYQDARRHLVEELGIEPGAELRELEAKVLAQDPSLDPPVVVRTTLVTRDGARPAPAADGDGASAGGRDRRPGPDGAAPPAATTPRRRGNVPRPLTVCLGRQRELRDVLELLDSHRLVTLVGPGGAGKTRLAYEVAHELAPAVPEGVWLADLAGVRDAGGVLSVLVRALRLDESVLAGGASPRTLDDVALALADRRLVLLVDNCEHVVDEVAVLVESLLAHCPDLRVLATSRETLGVPGEFLYVVPPLPLDDAVELFVERASAGAAAPVAALTDGARDLVVEICRRLDGLPLAIELAAARARHLDLAEIVDRLDRRFELLTEGPRTAAPRQRTLRAVVDWSYELLDPDEQRVFERLSVFSGGATLEAARAVCADGDVDPRAVETLLGRLVDKSLVVLRRTPAGARFGLLQTLADYGADRLAERGETAATIRRHVEWARTLAARAAMSRAQAGSVTEVRAVQLEAANLQQAIAWALEEDPLVALELASNLGWHWFTTMQAGLAWEVLTTALDAAPDDAPDALVAQGRAVAGLAGVMAGQAERAFALSASAHEIEERIGDPRRLGWHCFIRATQHVFATDPRPAAEWLAEARRWFTEIDDEHGLATVDFQQGVVTALLGDLTAADELLRRAVATCRRTGNHMTLMAALARLGEVAQRDGRLDDAYAAWQELHELATEAAVPALVSLAAAGMALIKLDQDEPEAAAALSEAAMAASGEGFSPLVEGYALAAWGSTQATVGDRRQGVERMHEAAGLFSRIGYHGGASECWLRLSRLNAQQGACEDAVRCAEQAVECASHGDDAVARRAAEQQLDAARRLVR